MIRVIHLIPRDGIGGVESAARSMLDGPQPKCDFKLQFIESGGGPSENNPFAHIQSLRSILRFEPHVLVCSLWRTAPIALAFKLLRPRSHLIVFLHLPATIHVLDKIFNWLMLRVCDAVWADSSATMEARGDLRRQVLKRIISFVTQPCLPSSGDKEAEPRFVFWGRLNKQKGLDRAISFMRQFKAFAKVAQFEIWGPDGGVEQAIRDQVSRSGLGDTVRLCGPLNQDQLDIVAGRNSFFLQLSRNEGMAMSVVEAMQRQLVPVVTPVGEIANYCRDGENAIVVTDPDKLDEAIIQVNELLKDPDRFKQISGAAQNYWRSAPLYRDDFCNAIHELAE